MCGGRGGGVGGRRGGGVGTHIRTRTHHQSCVTGPEGLSVKGNTSGRKLVVGRWQCLTHAHQGEGNVVVAVVVSMVVVLITYIEVGMVVYGANLNPHLPSSSARPGVSIDVANTLHFTPSIPL